MSAEATIIRFNTPGFESGAYEDGNGDRYVLTFSPCSSLSEGAACGSESSLQKMSVFSNVTDSQLRDQSGMPDVVGESMADGHVVKKPGDPGSVLVWDAVIKQFVSKLLLPEGVDYEPYELSDGDPLRRS